MDKNGKSPAKGEGLIEFSGSFNNIRREGTRFQASLKDLKGLKAKYLAEKFSIAEELEGRLSDGR